MDGLEFTERVKQDVTTSHIPVILLTAKTDENDHTEGYLRGADADVYKRQEITRAERLHKQMQIYAKNIHSLWLDKDNSLWLGLFLKGALHYIPPVSYTHLKTTI